MSSPTRFIDSLLISSGRWDDTDDSEVRVLSQKNYDLCVQAANRITSIIVMFKERFCVRRAPVFLSYYVFTASIMHVTTRAFFGTGVVWLIHILFAQ